MKQRFADVKSGGCVVVNFTGLKGPQSAGVRAALTQKGVRITVVRNRLCSIALREMGMAELADILKGPTALVTCGDPIAAARAAGEVAKATPSVKLAGGYAEGRVLGADGIQKLANLPSREVLLSQTLTCMVSPAQRFANGLVLVMQQLGSVMCQLKEKKQQEEGAGQAPVAPAASGS